MKLHQLNIWQGRLIMNVNRFLEKSMPDILCLQEMCSSPTGRSYMFDNLQDIQKKMDYPHVYFSPICDWGFAGQQIEFGNCILSRYPLQPVKTVFTWGEYRHNIDFSKNEERINNFQHAIVTKDGVSTHIINHHGFWFDGDKVGNAETDRQMGMIADYIKTLDGSVIFTGDLNLEPTSPSLARLNTEMENLCITHKVETTRNFTSFRPDQVCDYIFVRGVKVKAFRAYDDVVSDHNLLELVFNES